MREADIMSLTDALKTKVGSKHLSTVIDADGKVIQVETREDEEQSIKCQEIIDILVAAGYFRARIKGLSPFDKVVGGMVWCIDSCNIDIDVDLLFQENATIGQKISLTEKIVAVLPKMKCPYQIEPHQIQGLDFIHLFHVIQWLVKTSLESREAKRDYLRSYAIDRFDMTFSFPEDREAKAARLKALVNIQALQEKYRPRRQYRRTGPAPTEQSARVISTLIEYGHGPQIQGPSNDTHKEAQSLEEVQMRQMLHTMATMPEENRIGAAVVGSIVSKQADEITKAVEQYSELQAGMEGGVVAEHRRLEERVKLLEAEKQRLESSLTTATQELEQFNELTSQKSPAAVARTLTEQEEGVLKKLQLLLVTNEKLKQQETQFREQCKVELAKLQMLVSEAEESDTSGEGVDAELRMGEELLERVMAERLSLARHARAVASLQRQLDQVPSRTELAQYQRRFLELYTQVSAKHLETKQYYTLYNTLNDTHQYLNKELGLLNSILDNYTQAMASQSAKEQFMNQFDGIIDGIKQNKSKVEQRRNEERRQRDNLSSELLGLVELQRHYVTVLKQLSIECRTNEALLAQVRQATPLHEQ